MQHLESLKIYGNSDRKKFYGRIQFIIMEFTKFLGGVKIQMNVCEARVEQLSSKNRVCKLKSEFTTLYGTSEMGIFYPF